MDTKNKSIFDMDLVFFDTETTGLPVSAEILEIGFVKARARTFEKIEEGDIKLLPGNIERASAESLEMCGYDPEEWAREGVGRANGFEQFLKHTDGAMLVGHNLPFDWMHLERELKEHGLAPNYFYKGLDTYSLAWAAFGENAEFMKFSLFELSAFFGIDQGRAHRAIDDARTTYQVFLKLHELARKERE